MEKKTINIMKFNEISANYAAIGCKMLDLLNDMVADLTDNGKKVIVPINYPLVTDNYKEIRYVEDDGAYVVNQTNIEISVYDLNSDDWFILLTFLSSKCYSDNYNFSMILKDSEYDSK